MGNLLCSSERNAAGDEETVSLIKHSHVTAERSLLPEKNTNMQINEPPGKKTPSSSICIFHVRVDDRRRRAAAAHRPTGKNPQQTESLTSQTRPASGHSQKHVSWTETTITNTWWNEDLIWDKDKFSDVPTGSEGPPEPLSFKSPVWSDGSDAPRQDELQLQRRQKHAGMEVQLQYFHPLVI